MTPEKSGSTWKFSLLRSYSAFAHAAAQAVPATSSGRCGDDVDRRADTAGRDGSAAGLVDFEAAETPSDARLLKSNERPVARLKSTYWSPPTELTKVVAIWRPLTVTRLNSGPNPRTVTCEPSPLMRLIETPGTRCSDFGEVGVRELADIFGRNRIDDTEGFALYVHRTLEAGADAGHHDGVGFIYGCRVLCHGGRGENPKRQGRNACRQNRPSDRTNRTRILDVTNGRNIHDPTPSATAFECRSDFDARWFSREL